MKIHTCLYQAAIILIIVLLTLVNSNLFGNPTYAAYFGYILSIPVFVFLTAITNRKQINIQPGKPIYAHPLIYLFLFTIYYYVQTLILQSKNAINEQHVYLLGTTLFLSALILQFRKQSININFLFRGIIIIAAIESLLCIAQATGCVASMNDYLRVTGSWINPNVTAMFLTLVFPAALHLLLTQNKQHRKWYIAALVLITTSIVLLQCRTAWIGAIAGSSLYLYHYYGGIKALKQSRHRKLLIAATVLLLLSLPFTALYLYQYKQGSAQGRQLVWKISQQMIARKPFTGYGYTNFDREYNLAQAAYFAQGSATPQEIANASHVKMAYNELLQTAIEGGLIATILFLAIIISLLLIPVSKQQTGTIAAHAAIAAFACMSLFNFTVQAIPVLSLFVIYAAILIAARNYKEPASPSKTMKPSKPIMPRLTVIAISIIAIAIFITQIRLAGAYIRNKEAKQAIQQGQPAQALQILQPLQNMLRNSDSYWANCATAFAMLQQYSNALKALEKATRLTSNPDAYMQSGYYHRQLKQYEPAVHDYTTARNIQPSRIAPVYALMQLYAATGDTLQAIDKARTVLSMQPKGVSAKADDYKKEADRIIEQLQHKAVDTIARPAPVNRLKLTERSIPF